MEDDGDVATSAASAGKNHNKYRRDKPWDHEGIDHWANDKYVPPNTRERWDSFSIQHMWHLADALVPLPTFAGASVAVRLWRADTTSGSRSTCLHHF